MVSFHATVIPVLIKSLQTTSTLLDKAEAHAKAKGTPFSSLFSARLVDDMLPLSAQVTITVLFARKGIQLLTTRDDLVAALEYKEYSVEESRAQLEETLEALRKVLPEHVDGKEEEVVQVSMYEKSADVSAKDYAYFYLLPTIYFHVTTLYDILRKEGVPVGKADYLTHYIAGWNFA